MVITESHKSLIGKLVASNKRFSGNEDLFEDFCSEAMERSCFLLQKTDDIERIQGYLNKIVTSAIIKVLKTSGRIRRNPTGYEQIRQTSINTENALDDGFLELKDPTVNFVEQITQKETLQEIFNVILALDAKFPKENYKKIFKMKYIENKKQREIAKELEISQGEVSKRLFSLMEQVNSSINQE